MNAAMCPPALVEYSPHLVVANVLGDPRHEAGDAGVDARELSLAASNAPGNDARLHPLALVDHQRATRVTL